jgi:hypothetical protein
LPPPEYQYVPPDNWPVRIIVEIEEPDGSEPGPTEDDWSGPDWVMGASLIDFVRYLSPDIWRRLVSCQDHPFAAWRETEALEFDEAEENLGKISDPLREQLRRLREHWSGRQLREADEAASDVAFRIVLERTAAGQEFVLKYLPQNLNSDWAPLPRAWHDKLMRFGGFRPGAPRRFKVMGSMIEYDEQQFELAVFRSDAYDAQQTSPSATHPRRTNKGGRPAKYDWIGATLEIGRIAALEGLPPERSKLLHRLIDWMTENWPEVPSESEVRKLISRAYDTPGLAV